MRHYHADGEKEFIIKAAINLLKSIRSTFTWSLADAPELNGVSERKFKTFGERCLSMMLQAGFPTDFWWDVYENSNYTTN